MICARRKFVMQSVLVVRDLTLSNWAGQRFIGKMKKLRWTGAMSSKVRQLSRVRRNNFHSENCVDVDACCKILFLVIYCYVRSPQSNNEHGAVAPKDFIRISFLLFM